jgi:hypothetical protein
MKSAYPYQVTNREAIISNVCNDIRDELLRQQKLKMEGKFSWTCADEAPASEKLAVLAEEFGEVSKEVMEDIIASIQEKKAIKSDERSYDMLFAIEMAQQGREDRLYKELIQVAAVAVAWCEALYHSLDSKDLRMP